MEFEQSAVGNSSGFRAIGNWKFCVDFEQEAFGNFIWIFGQSAIGNFIWISGQSSIEDFGLRISVQSAIGNLIVIGLSQGNRQLGIFVNSSNRHLGILSGFQTIRNWTSYFRFKAIGNWEFYLD